MFFMPDEPVDGQQKRTSLLQLGDSIHSLLGSKSDLTFTWAESVRLIIEDQYAPSSSPDSPTQSEGTLSDSDEIPSSNAELQAQLQKLRTAFGAASVKRRATLNRYLDLKGNIRVFCRVRPLLPSERRARTGPLVTPDTDKVIIPAPGKSKDFHFDRVFDPVAPQDDVFQEVQPIIQSALDGHNVCIFAYGQTGTGKTFTMEGNKESPGVVPRTLEQLFIEASKESNAHFSYSLSMLEVYMGSLRDLLVPRRTRINDPPPKCLAIQMGPTGFIEVENLTELPVSDFQQARRFYQIGSRARSTSWTNANETSSRSHCLLRISITCENVDGSKSNSKMWLIDLGGSERLLKTQAKGQTLQEGRSINMSLSALCDVINALQKKQPHVPFRNSKLTQILQDSLGEDSKTIMLVHVSPKQDDLGETACSLAFGKRAKGINLGRELTQAEKEEKEAAMAELLNQIKGYQKECQKINERIQKIEAKLEENKERVANEAAAAKLREEQEAAAAKLREEQAAAAAQLREEQEAAAARFREEQEARRDEEELERELQALSGQHISVRLQEELKLVETPRVAPRLEQENNTTAAAVFGEEALLQAETPKVPPPIRVRALVGMNETEIGGRSVPPARTSSMTPSYLPRFMTPTASSRRKHRYGSEDFDALLAGGAGDRVLKIEEKSATHLKKAFGCKFTDLNLSTANSTVVKLERRHTIEAERRATMDPKSKQWPKPRDNGVPSPTPAGAEVNARHLHRVRHSSDESVLRSQQYNAVEQPHHAQATQADGGKSWLNPLRGSQKSFLTGHSVRPDQREFPTASENVRSSHPRSEKLEKLVAANCRASIKGQRRWTLECSSKLSCNRRV